MIDLTWSFQSTLQICPPPRCAGWARNPKGPQITPFCHQMGRHPTIWDFKTGIRHRIPARISPWGSRGLNPNFFSLILDPKMPKSRFSGRVSNLSATHSHGFGAPGAHRGPRGARPWAAQGAQGPRGDSGVLAGPGTPRDPKSHLFATKWVAIPPFGTLKTGSGTEFWPGSRRGGPAA